ncbi:alpha/beta family hydrolase, partial [Actinotalea sp. C106]|uniref:alpha/beta hydrolase family protein n=1 Tax=Actinotalea sp. C106 TaxID=2908644 RepID=UPI0020284D00
MPELRVDVQEVPTAHGAARVHVHAPALTPRGLLVLGHGAGGGVDAPDLLAVTAVATDLGMTTALVEQPYRAAGRRGSPRAPTLDAAWTEVLAHLVAGPGDHTPLVTGGRSAGARVACRTAEATGADAVLCLAFPVQPPGRPDRPSRMPELDGAGAPVLVVQGERDPYGMP